MDVIENKKKLANILKRAKNTAKPNKCIVCDKIQTSFCNSHLIPQMVLKTIAENGKLLHPNTLIGIEILDTEKGINNAGTFQFICRKCDSELFQDYENPDKMKNYPTDKMMAEIALKNMLLMLSKRNEEKEIFNIVQKEMNGFVNKEILDEIQEVDIQEYLNDLHLYQQIIKNNSTGCFQVLYWKKLPYIVPVAVQSPIAVYKDMNGDIINDVYEENPDCRMQNLHVCVFPIENETIVLVFYHKRDKNYRRLRHQFNSSSDEKCLRFINYLIFAYTEHYFFAKSIRNKIEFDENMVKLSKEINGNPDFGFMEIQDFFSEYISVSMNDIPNFLSEEYSLQKDDQLILY